jgi:hypothetical protein
MLRLRVGFAGVPLAGVVYWTLALYLVPFAGGLDIAALGVAVLGTIHLTRWWRNGATRPAWTRVSWVTLILVVGCLPYLTTLTYHYVPIGMDASMHATAATLIARHGGLPATYAPHLPDLTFPPMNLGLPTIAGVAIRWGGETAAVMLACHHLTFTLLILATYALLRTWLHRTPAALLAVASVWMARGSQASLGWGGFPTVLSVAVGLFAARLIVLQARATGWRASVATGAAVAAIPLVHGVGGGTWLYCIGPWATLAAFLQTRGRIATLRSLALTGVTAALLLMAYRFAGTVDVQADAYTWTQNWQSESAVLHDPVWLSAFDYVRKDAGSVIVLVGWLACGVLAVRRQWTAAGILAAAWLMLVMIVANSRFWILPASFLLYPERVLYWAAPISAVALGLAWRAWPTRQRMPQLPAAAVGIGLLGLAGYFQNQFYQKIVREDCVTADGWDALVWARGHLRPEHDFVQTPYNSTGSYLPAVARVGCTGAHHHHFIAKQVSAACERRTITHVLVDQSRPPVAVPPGDVVFRNRTITIVQLESSSRGSQTRAGL